MPEEVYNYNYLKKELKSKLSISSDEEIEVFNSDNVEINKLPSFTSNSGKKLKVALLNKRFGRTNSSTNIKGLSHEEEKKIKDVLKDEVCTNKYGCYYKGCRKTFNIPTKLFNHIKIHSTNLPHKCDFPGCGKSFL